MATAPSPTFCSPSSSPPCSPSACGSCGEAAPIHRSPFMPRSRFMLKPGSHRARFGFLLAAALIASSAQAAPPAGFEQRVEKLRTDFGAPGVTIAIVENGKTTLAHGWGVRQVGTSLPVGADTTFATGSTGKAFTTAALAILVDRGKIKWDDKIIDHMPDFRMWDPWVTREMTIRDLLVHRSGLGLG